MKRWCSAFLVVLLSWSLLARPAGATAWGIDTILETPEDAKLVGAAYMEIYIGIYGGVTKFPEWMAVQDVRVDNKGSYWHIAYTWNQCGDNPPPDPEPDGGIVACTGAATIHLEISKKDGRVRALFPGR